MVYLIILGIIVSSLMQMYRLNYLLNLLRDRDLTIKTLFKMLIGWPVGVLFAASSIVVVCIWKLPGYYVQLADMIYTLLIVAIIDGKTHEIPNRIMITLLISQLIVVICVSNTYPYIWNVLISIVILLLLMLVSKISKEQIGMGDVKLIVILNLIYGLSFTLYSMIISLFIMLLFIVPCMIRKKVNLKSQIPFAPFYTAGVIIYILLNSL